MIAFHFTWGTTGILVIAMLFVALLAVVNLRGVGGSVKLNVGLTCIEVSVLVLRRDTGGSGRHFTTPTALPVIGCLASLYLVTPLSGRSGQQYLLAAILVGVGVLVSLATLPVNRRLAAREVALTADAAALSVVPG